MLKNLQSLVKELNTTNSTNEKKDILKKYPQCKELLKWIYSPYTQFNVTSTNLKKRSDLIDYNAQQRDLINILKELNERQVTGHNAIALVNGFIQGNKEYADLIYSIIDKNLKTRTDAKLINAIYPGLIPEFNCALANKYEDQAHKIDFTKDVFFASRKLDGVRCLAIPTESTWKLMSRQGKEFDTLQKVINDLTLLNLGSAIVFDGEICILDENGNERFNGIMKEIRKKDHTIAHPRYKIFDAIFTPDFEKGESNDLFSSRKATLDLLREQIKDLGIDTLDVVEQTPIESESHLMEMMDYAVSQGWEGLIIRKDAPYKGKRSNDLLKVKKMHDAEYVVKSIELGPFRIISKETCLEVEEEMLSRVNIEHKGNIVGVGSGFNLEQRRLYRDEPEKIIGKTITVKYFEECNDKTGKKSLRFPIIKHIYEEGRDV